MTILSLLQAWAQTQLTTARERAADESGQGAVEYVGIVIVVVAVIAALAAFGPDIGDAIGNGLQTIITNFVGE